LEATRRKKVMKSRRYNVLKILGGTWIGLMVVMALGAGFWAPDTSPDANRQWLSARALDPGTRVWVRQAEEQQGAPEVFIRVWVQDQWVLGQPPQGAASKSLGTLAAMQTAEEQSRWTSHTFWLGSDPLGRDVLSRLMRGARMSLGIGAVAVVISLLVGLLLGVMAGWYGGFLARFINGITHFVWAIPTLLLVMVITLFLGQGVVPVFVAVGLTMWVDVARLMEGEVRRMRGMDFVVAAKALGFPGFRIWTRHVLPGLMGPLMVVAASNFAAAILIESGLSFMGIGVQPPAPTWGGMVEAHRMYLMAGKPYLALFPGLAIVLLVLAFTFAGQGSGKREG
jgi:peptide/nickel transport system permease protein